MSPPKRVRAPSACEENPACEPEPRRPGLLREAEAPDVRCPETVSKVQSAKDRTRNRHRWAS